MALVTKRVMNACPRSAILVIHFIVGGTAVYSWQSWEQDEVLSVYGGEWAYRTRSEAFKDKARLQFHSKNFDLKLLKSII